MNPHEIIDSEIFKCLPSAKFPSLSDNSNEEQNHEGSYLNDSKLIEALKERQNAGDRQAEFQLGQLLFMQDKFEESFHYFRSSVEKFDDPRSKFQLSILLYDNIVPSELAGFYPKNMKVACDFMKEIITLPLGPQYPKGQRELVFAAAYNLGRAYFQGYGVLQSSEDAVKLWHFAADDGSSNGSTLAQTALGYFHSCHEHHNIDLAVRWHREACGNGSIESQAALGVIYLYGLGLPQDWCAALSCLTEASAKGCIQAQGNLVYLFYVRKMYTQAVHLAERVTGYALDEVEMVCKKSDTLLNFAKRAVATAAFLLGRCYDRGVGVQKSAADAKNMFSLAFKWDHQVCMRFQTMANHCAI